MDGIVVVDKPSGYTSRDVVNILTKKFNTRKVGHTGTLDPLATGVLVICMGKALKICELITDYKKEYIADVIIGYETDMLDITGTKTKESIVNITKEQVINALNSFLGESKQEVPMYSAIKINGKKLYEYARSGQEVQVPVRDINVYELELLSEVVKVDNYYEFKIRCVVSKGTYVRALIRDIGYKLGSYGTMKSLRRTMQGRFNIEMANTIEDILNDKYKIYSISDSLNIKKVIVSDDMAFKIKNGVWIDKYTEEDKVLFTLEDGTELAIYERCCKDNRIIMKPWKVF